MLADRSGDPNFPQGLRIHPSSSQRGPLTVDGNGHQEPDTDRSSVDVTQAGSWEQDTAEDIECFGIAGRIWEAAYLLACYLRPVDQLASELEFDPPCSLFHRSNAEPLTIVELGSGAGYGSLRLAGQILRHSQDVQAKLLQARLVLTDLENVVPLMKRNVARAGHEQATDLLDVRVRRLAWGNKDHAAELVSELAATRAVESEKVGKNPLSHILCSDLVYFPELLAPLLRSIIWLSGYGIEAESDDSCFAQRGPELIISYKVRSLTKEQPFWSALSSWFELRAVDCRSKRRQRHSHSQDQSTDDTGLEWHRFGSQGEDYGASEASDQELFVFVGHRRKETIGCMAPEDDTELMSGKRLRPGQGPEGEACFELESSSGQDYFEWLLLVNMGACFG